MTYKDDDFAFEPVPGLPAHLPRGEEMLWQGSPQWRSLAWRGMYVRPVAIYFGLIMAWRLSEGLGEGGSIIAASAYALELLPAALGALGVLLALAWLYAGSTIYTITSRRVVIRSGVALPMTVNLPFNIIENAALRLSQDGSGDVPLKIAKSQNVYALALWPNLRPWNFSRPEPMLRSIPDAQRIAGILAKALQVSLEDGESSSAGRAQAAGRTEPRAQAASSLTAHDLQGAVS
ncbi:MAG: PH domain-containing protein [Alphaproteobacteria bacterium]|nr:PH domain-containing protein [Alphaproteobacteria bacterium]